MIAVVGPTTVMPMGPGPVRLLVSKGITNHPGRHHRESCSFRGKDIYRTAG